MDIKIDIDFGKLESRSKSAINKAQMWLDSEIISDCEPYLPFLTGELQSSTRSTIVGNGEIIYDTPYARRLYYGDQFNFNKQNHPLATTFWFEYAKATNETKWINGVNEVVKRGI